MAIVVDMRIVRDYTPMIREAAKQPTRIVQMQQQKQYGMVAEREDEYNKIEE